MHCLMIAAYTYLNASKGKLNFNYLFFSLIFNLLYRLNQGICNRTHNHKALGVFYKIYAGNYYFLKFSTHFDVVHDVTFYLRKCLHYVHFDYLSNVVFEKMAS